MHHTAPVIRGLEQTRTETASSRDVTNKRFNEKNDRAVLCKTRTCNEHVLSRLWNENDDGFAYFYWKLNVVIASLA